MLENAERNGLIIRHASCKRILSCAHTLRVERVIAEFNTGSRSEKNGNQWEPLIFYMDYLRGRTNKITVWKDLITFLTSRKLG